MKTLQKKLKLSKGEVREELLERQDLSVLDASASRIENFISTPFGGAKTRDGTENIDEVATNLLVVTQPTITSEVGGTPNKLYNETDYYESLGIENATLLILYDWNLGVTPPSEMIAYWKADEASGNLLDALGNYDAVETGTVPSATGKIGGARGPYTASTNYFSPASTAPFRKDLFVVEGWIYVSSSGLAKTILGTSNGAADSGYSFFVKSTGALQMYMNGVGSAVSPGGVGYDAWVYVSFIRYGQAAGESRLYINNSFISSAGDGGAIVDAGAGVFRIGVQRNLINAFTPGYLDEFAFWDLTSTSKSLAEIEAILTERYNSGVGKKYSV